MKTKSTAVLLFNEVNRLRKHEGLEPIGLMQLAHKIGRFHEDRNPRVAEALKNLGMPEPSKSYRGPSSTR